MEAKDYAVEKTDFTICSLSQFTFNLGVNFGWIQQRQRRVLLTTVTT